MGGLVQVITSRCVLANLLAHYESVDDMALHAFKTKLKIKAPQVYVDISRAAIGGAIESNPALFQREGSRIIKKADFLTPEFVDKTLNKKLSTEIRTAIHEACEVSA